MEWFYIQLQNRYSRQLHFPTLVLTSSGSKGSRNASYLSQNGTPSGFFIYSTYILVDFFVKVKLFI